MTFTTFFVRTPVYHYPKWRETPRTWLEQQQPKKYSLAIFLLQKPLSPFLTPPLILLPPTSHPHPRSFVLLLPQQFLSAIPVWRRNILLVWASPLTLMFPTNVLVAKWCLTGYVDAAIICYLSGAKNCCCGVSCALTSCQGHKVKMSYLLQYGGCPSVMASRMSWLGQWERCTGVHIYLTWRVSVIY